jgi:hypothetical protein
MTAAPLAGISLRLTIVYLCEAAPADTDNIIKPILDAIVGLVIEDDLLVSDVDGHRRFLTERIVLASLPPLLQSALLSGTECVYVRVSKAEDLRSYL